MFGKCVLLLTICFSAPFVFANDVDLLVQNYTYKHPIVKLKWDWGESIFLYGLSKYPKFNDLLKTYTEKWVEKLPPNIDKSDRCPAALAAVKMVQTGLVPEGKILAELVENYIKSETQNELGTLDHLGHSWHSFFYASSVWVDSLMMYTVFAGQWGKLKGDKELISFALSQPMKFAQVLQAPKSGLFWHAYFFQKHQTVPADQNFWLRGNGWALTSFIELIDAFTGELEWRFEIGQIIEIFQSLAKSIIQYQKKNGAFETILNRPGHSYDETSGTMLVAYAFAKAHRLGLLDDRYLISAQKAFAFGQTQLKKSKNGLSLGGISGPTNPGSGFTYKLVPRKSDLHYGVGAFLLAASELLGH